MGKKKIGKFIIPQGKQFEVLRQELKMLGLDGAIASFELIGEQIKKENGTNYDFLQRLLELEITYKEENRVSHWLQKSNLLPLMTLNDYDFKLQPNLDPVVINELATCRFIEQGKNIMLLGPPGIGKTHLAISLGYEAIQNGFEVRCMKHNEFIDAIQKGNEARLYQQLVKAQLLILDDVGLYETNDESGKFLSDVIDQRYTEGTSTIITSNKNPTTWGSLFGTDKDRIKRTLDRLFDHRRRVTINIRGGVSYRVPHPLSELDEPIKKRSQIAVTVLKK